MTVEAIQQRILKAMHPAHGEEPPEKWQQRKSAQTRERLIEAGIDCVAQSGFAGLTTAAVAERCGVSRGAMHHHFATRMELVSAVVEIVVYRRMQIFLTDYFAAVAGRAEDEMVQIACEAHWQSIHTREYAAYLELAVAARIDAELAEHFLPAARRYDEVWIAEMIEAFPQWAAHWDAMKLASDFTQAAQMGMLLQEPVMGRGERMERMRALLVSTIRTLYADT